MNRGHSISHSLHLSHRQENLRNLNRYSAYLDLLGQLGSSLANLFSAKRPIAAGELQAPELLFGIFGAFEGPMSYQSVWTLGASFFFFLGGGGSRVVRAVWTLGVPLQVSRKGQTQTVLVTELLAPVYQLEFQKLPPFATQECSSSILWRDKLRSHHLTWLTC